MPISARAKANLEAFAMALEQNDIKFNDVSDDKTAVVRIGYGLDNIDDLVLFFFFDADGGTMHMGSAAICHVPDAKVPALLQAVNQANIVYRWLTFYLDKDNDLVASADQILSPDTVGDTCRELLSRSLSIIDEAYPSFMKAIWSD